MPDHSLNSSKSDVTVKASTPTETVGDQGIDEWELKASRRILRNLRTLLAGEQMLDLIKDQVEESDRQLKQYLAESDGEYTGTQVKLAIKGLSIAQFMPTLQEIMGGVASDDEKTRREALDMAFTAHPEHYAMVPGTPPAVIETMGGLPTR